MKQCSDFLNICNQKVPHSIQNLLVEYVKKRTEICVLLTADAKVFSGLQESLTRNVLYPELVSEWFKLHRQKILLYQRNCDTG